MESSTIPQLYARLESADFYVKIIWVIICWGACLYFTWPLWMQNSQPATFLVFQICVQHVKQQIRQNVRNKFWIEL